MDPASRRPNPAFVLNDPRYAGASILMARENFGCGSSREHAVWALSDAGFRCVIAPSFADIFYNNCFKNGVLPLVLPEDTVDELFAAALDAAVSLRVDLPAQTVTLGERSWTFDIDAFRKQCLLDGLDAIGLTLQHAEAIREYERRRAVEAPWLFTNENAQEHP